MISADQALQRLKDGNARFVSGETANDARDLPTIRERLADGQEPFAIILGCSDSRVPAELVFDQSLGDLFVIRVAGNVVAPSQIGSVEFAASQFGTPLVVILGHTFCGAIRACISELKQPQENQSRNLRSIVRRITPAIAPLLDTDLANDPAKLERHATRANILASANQLCHGSEIIEDFVDEKRLVVIGAEYDLETGNVEFLDTVW